MAYITEIYEWEGDDTQPFGTFNWKTKLYNLEDRGYLSGGYVIYVNAPHQGWPVGGLPLAGSVIRDTGAMPTYTGMKELLLKIYADGTLISTTQIFTQLPFRLDAQLRANRWEFELEGNVENVKRIEFAPSVVELMQSQQGG